MSGGRGAVPAMRAMTRRDLLGGTTGLGGVLAIGAAPAEGPREADRVLHVVVTGGHPGDPEYGCGGTVARLADLGHGSTLLYLNNGERPGNRGRRARRRGGQGVRDPQGPAALRRPGRRRVGRRRGHYEAFRAILEAERPDVVFTHWPIDNHADHRAMSMLVYDAWLKMKKAFSLYYYEVSNGEDTLQFAPDALRRHHRPPSPGSARPATRTRASRRRSSTPSRSGWRSSAGSSGASAGPRHFSGTSRAPRWRCRSACRAGVSGRRPPRPGRGGPRPARPDRVSWPSRGPPRGRRPRRGPGRYPGRLTGAATNRA